MQECDLHSLYQELTAIADKLMFKGQRFFSMFLLIAADNQVCMCERGIVSLSFQCKIGMAFCALLAKSGGKVRMSASYLAPVIG